MGKYSRETIRKITLPNGETGWFFPDGAQTPVQILCKKCPYIINAQVEFHRLCMEVNRRFGGINGWTCGVNGFDENKARDYYRRIGIDIKTGLPIGMENSK